MASLGGLQKVRGDVEFFHIERDTARAGAWIPTRKAYKRLIYSGTTHHLVLQDDVVVSKNFIKTVRLFAELLPNELVCFFSMRNVAQEAADLGKNWFTTPTGVWGNSILFPTAMLQGILRWERKHIKPDCYHDDERIAAYLKYGPGKGKKVWHPCPSLVEHTAPSDSLLGHNHPRRVNQVWIGDADPLEIDWAKDIDSPHKGHDSWDGRKWFITQP